MELGHFAAACISRFGFLRDDFGFSHGSCDRTDDGYACRFHRGEVGVSVEFLQMEFWIYVRLWRLVDGKFTPNSGEMTPSTLLRCFYLDDLVAVRAHAEEQLARRNRLGAAPRTIETMLDQAALDLRRYAGDVLKGDFSALDDVEPRIKERARSQAFAKWGERAREFGWA